MTNFSRRQVLSLPMAASVVGAGAAGAAYAADSNSKVNAPDFDAIEDRMTLLTKRGASLSIRQKHLAVLSVAAGLGFEDLGERTAACRRHFHLGGRPAPAALADGLAPGDIEEAVFHASPYAGMARTRAVLAGVHAAMTAAGIALPLESRTVVSDENRLQKGIAVQTEIFGEQITRMHQTTPAERRSLMIDDLSGWCFGDFYTRKGLSIAERELATFCTIAALGGCEAQLSAHAAANLRCGNTKDNLIDALQCAVVYLGFPRTLNACAVVDKVNP